MASIDINGTTIDYDDAGQGGPPVLLVHGWCGDRSHLAPQFDHFRQNHRTVALDRAGHGKSPLPAGGDLRVRRHADDLARLCEELGLYKPIVVMHSMDRIVFDLAARYPDLPGALVLIDSPTLAPGYNEMAEGLLEPLASPAYQDVIRGFADQVAFLPTDDPAIKDQALSCFFGTPQEVIVNGWREFIEYDEAAAIEQITVPVLHIGAVFPNDLERFHELCPQLVTGKVVGAGHFAPLLVPTQVNAMIDSFIATSVPAPEPVG